MAACEFGAQPKPGAEDLQVWLDRLALASDIASLIKIYAPAAFASIAASLVSIPGVCAENPDPPDALTLEDLLRQTASTVTAGALADPVVVEKAYAWLKYQQFLAFCDCKPPELTPGFNCTNAPATINLGSLGSIAGPYPVTIDQSVINSWITHPNGDWEWGFDGGSLIDGGAFDGNDLLVQWQATNGAWVDGPDLLRLNQSVLACELVSYQASTPRFGTSTAARIVNNAGGTHVITNFRFCFCPRVGTPPPLPVQPPLTGVPTPPALACGPDDLCAMVTELSARLTVIAAQVSDIQASLIGRNVLTVLDSQNISGEGEAQLALGTRAVSVELTALSSDAFTSALGRPRGLMRVGSVRYGDGIGYSPRRFIDADRFDDVVPVGALSVSWQLLSPATAILKFLG